MVLARPHVRLTTKIRLKNNLYPYRHFTKHLMDAFEKSPQENALNSKSSSLLIWWLKSYTDIFLRQFPQEHTTNHTKIKSFSKNRTWQSLRQLVAVRTFWKRAVAAGHIATKTGAQLGNQTRSSDRVRSRRVNRCETDILREKHSAGDCSRIRVGRLLTETSEKKSLAALINWRASGWQGNRISRQKRLKTGWRGTCSSTKWRIQQRAG
jgi:hypothetical protein